MSRRPTAQDERVKASKEFYKKGGPRGTQQHQQTFLRTLRGGSNDWLKNSLPEDVVHQTAADIEDRRQRMFKQGTPEDLHALGVTLSTANKHMEDIRQPLDNPFLDEEAAVLARETARYREIATDRHKRAEEILAAKPRMHLTLRLLSGEELRGTSIMIASNYEEVQQAFIEVFPWHRTPVVPEYPDGRAIHPQTAHFRAGSRLFFRELAAPTDDVSSELQRLSAGWLKQVYRRELLALPTTLIAGGKKKHHHHRHHHHSHHHHHSSHHHNHHHSSHHAPPHDKDDGF